MGTATVANKLTKSQKAAIREQRTEAAGFWMERAEHYLDLMSPDLDQRTWDRFSANVQKFQAEAERVSKMSLPEYCQYHDAKHQQFIATGRVTL